MVMLELYELQICSRSIQPSTIAVHIDYRKLLLFDIGNVIRWDENTDNFHYVEPPYSSQKFHERKKITRNAFYWDCWSLAVIILEVIIGTEFVAEIKYFSHMEDTLDMCDRYLDEEIMTLLRKMIEGGNINQIKKMVNEILPKRPELFDQAIRGFE